MRSPTCAPKYHLYREVAAADSGPFIIEAHGINMGAYKTAHVQVVPIDKPKVADATALGTSNPAVEVYFWNEELALFIKTNPITTKAGLGAGVPYEFDVDAGGRIMFVAVTSAVVGGEGVALFVSGYEMDHTL